MEKILLGILLLTPLLPTYGEAEPKNNQYSLRLVDIPEESLVNFPVQWQRAEPGSLIPGLLERNLPNEANVNFLISGGGCRVFSSERKGADEHATCDLEVKDLGFGASVHLEQAHTSPKCA